MKPLNKKIIGVCIVIIVIISFFVIKNINQNKLSGPITIGAILPLSGDLANVGEDIRTGINLFLGKTPDAKIVIENDEGDTKKSISAVNKLMSIDNIKYFLGPLGPVASEAVYSSQINNGQNKGFFVALSMCADQFKKYENMLCIYPSPYFQLKETYKYPKTLGKKSFYSIVANDAFGEDVQKMTETISAEIGLQNIGKDTVDIKSTEFRTVAQKAIKTNPQFIMVITMNFPANIKIIKALKELGYTGMIMSGADVEEKTIEEFKDILEGVYLSGRAKLEYTSEFLNLYTNQKKEGAPNLYTAFGYVWADIIYSMLQSHEEITTGQIMDYVDTYSDSLAIKGMKYNHADKTIEFPMEIGIIKNGKIEFVFSSDNT